MVSVARGLRRQRNHLAPIDLRQVAGGEGQQGVAGVKKSQAKLAENRGNQIFISRAPQSYRIGASIFIMMPSGSSLTRRQMPANSNKANFISRQLGIGPAVAPAPSHHSGASARTSRQKINKDAASILN